MKTAICVTDDPSKAFRIQQVMKTLGFMTYAVDGFDTLFGCSRSLSPDIILVSELKAAKLVPLDIIQAIRRFGGSSASLPVIHLWARISHATPGAMGGPIATVVEPLTIDSAKTALARLNVG